MSWLKEYGLSLLDLHGPVGPEKDWTAAEEYRRLAGVELVRNRLEMAARLGGNVVIMHTGTAACCPPPILDRDTVRRSLDDLAPYARSLGVRIAIENGDWPLIHALLDAYPPDFLGLCYDSGHGNVDGVGLAELDAARDRLISVHLHDNDGSADEHRLPFTGTVDWARLAAILGASTYRGCISIESNMSREPTLGEAEFLAGAFAAGKRLAAMVAERS